ncbi:helix-turn-helix domain-containing protein [Oceanirhabdus sp. W0125-5]|uniref:helix-turn-helix domain-containing protein n=1 Tax=Oceanirhabdus sp. W0125-5 TaxID=2999116 RepID=UPI0022F30E21|nr:helix-turn-helix transcriptional regulator [Oceanirhabdus sp. W0125-5]WBW99250.1 helix-turn-helix transcriptional regulator [Oceanirhabdus sp. W0125-5]
MPSTIGKRIRELRKELKMTQSELAEPEMKKSMLSHIENGYANPSMKNLEHIARKLNKPIGYFFQDDIVYENNSVPKNQISFDEIIVELNNIDNLIQKKKYDSTKKEIIKFLSEYKFNEKSKIYGDIIYRLASCEIMLGELEEGEKHINIACNIYIENILFVDAARACMKLLKMHIKNFQYNKALPLLEKIYELYGKSTSKDIFFEIEMLIVQPAIYFAKGEFEKTIQICEEVISLSNQNRIYYLLDDAYRMMAITFLLHDNHDKFLFNMDKARKYVEFTNNRLNLIKLNHNYAKYKNMINRPLEALKYLEIYELNDEKKTFYYYIEHGKAEYYLGNYNKSLEDLNKVNCGNKVYYMMDCIYILTSKIYIGLNYNKLNEFQKAIEEIEEAITKIESYTRSEYLGFVIYANKELGFAYECLSEIYSEKGEYSKAYTLLKKSNELKVIYKNINFK